MTAALQDHVSHYCNVVYGEGMKAEVDKVVKNLIDLIPETSGFEIAHAVRVYNSQVPLSHVDNLDCPKRCRQWANLKDCIEADINFKGGHLLTKKDREIAHNLQHECMQSNVYCQRPSAVERRLEEYQDACPNYDLGLYIGNKSR